MLRIARVVRSIFVVGQAHDMEAIAMSTRSFLALLAAFSVASCSSTSAPRDRPAAAPVAVGGNVLATVDGVPITRADVELATRAAPDAHGGGAPASPELVLEQLVEQEMFAQRAISAH